MSRDGMEIDGRYRIVEELAVGAMGVVYRGERLKLGRPVAIKFLHPSVARSPQLIRRFEREARAMSRLSHPHCVSVIDFGVEEAPYLVMDFVTGQNLSDLLDDGPFSLERAVHVARQMLAGLAHAHDRDVIHRDVKPANVMLTEATGTGDHVRLLDFGLAKLHDGSGETLSTSNLAVGTPSYMSPEQARGDAVDARADLYATGVVLFELLTGRPPLKADETFETLRLHCEQPPPTLSETSADRRFSDELEALVARALEKDPADRFQSAMEFKEALERIDLAAAAKPALPGPKRSSGAEAPSGPAGAPDAPIAPAPPALSGSGSAARTEAPDEVSAARPARRRRWPAALAFAAILAAAAGAFALVVTRTGTEVSLETGAAEEPGAPDEEPHELVSAPSPPDGAGAAGAAAEGAAAQVAEGQLDAAAPRPGADAGAALEAGAGGDAAPAAELAATAEAEPAADAGAGPAAGAAEEPAAAPDRSDAPRERARRRAARKNRKPTVRDAEALVRAGKFNRAIRTVRALRREHPKSWYLPYLLGNLYFEKKWYTDGLKAYQAALVRDGKARRMKILIRNAIRALGPRATRARAARVLRRVGRPAVPHLRRAARRNESAFVRRRAAWLARVLARR